MELRLLDLSPTSSSTSNATRKTSVSRTQSRWQKLQGWRVSVLLCILIALFTFLVNLALTIWASSKGLEGGIATIQSGDCNTTKRLDLWLHLGINLLSTMLLGASNYTMQCLSSPTRGEIDKAHRQRIIVDIGIPSMRNLKRISWRKIVLWWLIALSSIPLHLLYNSAVFSSISTPSYMVAVVSPDFLNGAPFGASFIRHYYNATGNSTADHIGYDAEENSGILSDYDVQRIQKLRDSQSSLQRLDNDACLKAYRTDFIADRRDVLVVSSGHRMNDSLLSVSTSVPAADLPSESSWPAVSYSWTCRMNISRESYLYSNMDHVYPQKACPFPDHNWTIDGNSIEYCLSESIPQSCTLQFSLVIMIIVISCNLLKTVCMGLTVWKLSSMPLLTLGDAIASFLAEPDPNTKNNCLAERFCFRGSNHAGSDATILSINGPDISTLENLINDKGKLVRPGWDEGIRRWKPERYTWFNAASKKRWLLSLTLCVLTLIIAGILLGIGLNGELPDRSMSHLWSLGYGTVSPETIAHLYGSISGKLIPMILIANSPQALLSFLYLTYNALFTCMLTAKEWSAFAHQRKTLRVTCPVGNQRSTYWLQLPYRYGIPLLVMSAGLHWLVSQSLFLVRVTVTYQPGELYKVYYGQDDPSQVYRGLISSCGYSPIAIITVIPLGALLLLVVIGTGFRKYRKGMPLARSSSAAISASCHRPEEDVDAALLPVSWGAVSTDDPIGHCCFTSFEVSPPVEGKLYANRDAISSTDSGTATGVESESDQTGSRLRSRT